MVSIVARRQEAVSNVPSWYPQAGLLLLNTQSLYSPWLAAVISDSTSTSAIEAVVGSGAGCLVRWYLVPLIAMVPSLSSWMGESEGGLLGAVRMRSMLPTAC
jgi:hypothetical protein